MKIVLMHPPLDDATLPYHSTAYLAGHLVHKGFTDVAMRDINVEFVNHCLSTETVGMFYDEAERVLKNMKSRGGLGFEEQEQYYALSSAPRTSPKEISDAVNGFRNREQFDDYPTYLRNLNRITNYFSLLGALSYPAEIAGFTQMNRGRYSLYNLNDVLSGDLAHRVCYPFERYFQERLTRDAQLAEADLLGISIVYDHQMMHALHFARMLRQRWPDKRIVLGGTAISQFYKHLRDKAMLARFFDLCDAIVVGEGETAICDIAASGGDLAGRTDLTNTITYDRRRDRIHIPAIKYEDVPSLGSPIYDHPWDLYLSPERGINYSPTRGCYWNRCTFCDYGLNTDKPTSPWRERKIPQVISDVRDARERYGVRYVYFAVDVMAPGYLERLSDAIGASALDIRWSAELRLEKIFSAERCKKMGQAGCVCISFGMESGNQRILDLIDKGTKVKYMAETMRNFASAGIAVQLMAFTDFPTETPEEKLETIKFIKDNEPHWASGGMGVFLLTGTSMIAKNPERFGLTLVPTEDADVMRSVAYRVDSENGQRTALAEECDASFDDDGGVFPPVLGRPWAGGTDTLHSMIYYDKFGRLFFKDNPIERPAAEISGDRETLLSCSVLVNGALVESPFDLQQIIENRLAFGRYIRDRLNEPCEPTYGGFRKWSCGIPAVDATPASTYWLSTGSHALKLDKLVYKLLKASSSRPTPLKELLAVLPERIAAKMFDYFLELEQKGFLFFNHQDGKGRLVRADNRVVSRAITSRLPPFKLAAQVAEAPESGLVQIMTP